MEITKAEIALAAAAHNQSASQELMGSEILVKALQAEGVQYIWGYPGGAVLYIYDALYTSRTPFSMCSCATSRLRCMRPMAMHGRPVRWVWRWSHPVLVSPMPSPALPRRIWTAFPWSSSRARPTAAIGLDAFQECDTVGITRPIVKHNFLVKDARDLAMTMKNAGSTLIGQSFSSARYFWSRPSATSPMAHNGAASSGSNQGPLNPALAEAIKGRIAALKASDPQQSAPIPVDLVTAWPADSIRTSARRRRPGRHRASPASALCPGLRSMR